MSKMTEFLINHSNKTGIDLDSPSEFELMKAYFNAKHMFPDKQIKVFISSGGNGYHIEIHGVKSRLSVRRALCDCVGRMDCSESRTRNNINGDEFAVGDPLVDDILFGLKIINFSNIHKVQKRVEISEHYLLAERW